MRNPFILLAISASFLAACGGGGGGSVNGPVGRACITADRDAATRSLCSCIQRAADQTLNSSDQTRAARFFRDPQEAQDTRQSDRRADEAFWDRYNVFVDRARASCG
jgi:hypothetical protein